MADGEDNNGCQRQPHLLVVPYPAQGHINPMLQFSKRLHHKGATISFVLTNYLFNNKRISAIPPSISIQTISDGFDEGGFESADSVEAYQDRFDRIGHQTLGELLRRLSSSGNPVDCVVYDAFIPWALDAAKELGLIGALYFTQSCALGCIYYHLYRGDIKIPLPEKETVLPGLPSLLPSEMPSFITDPSSYPAFLDLVINQFRNIENADFVLCNTFYELEQEVLKWMETIWPVRTIGPNVPIEDDREYGFSFFDPDADSCRKWLGGRRKASVVYIAFGSYAALNLEQMEELAWGIKRSNSPFLWVVRPSEEAKLPEKFAEETAEQGVVVPWCNQMEILSHEAIGCFVTHCGWNSTLEAVSMGVPTVGMPQWTDQRTNAKCVMEVWRTGMRAPADERGVVRREKMEECIREIMEGGGERGTEIRRNSAELGTLARKAVAHGGSSDRNIEHVLAKMRLDLN